MLALCLNLRLASLSRMASEFPSKPESNLVPRAALTPSSRRWRSHPISSTPSPQHTVNAISRAAISPRPKPHDPGLSSPRKPYGIHRAHLIPKGKPKGSQRGKEAITTDRGGWLHIKSVFGQHHGVPVGMFSQPWAFRPAFPNIDKNFLFPPALQLHRHPASYVPLVMASDYALNEIQNDEHCLACAFFRMAMQTRFEGSTSLVKGR